MDAHRSNSKVLMVFSHEVRAEGTLLGKEAGDGEERLPSSTSHSTGKYTLMVLSDKKLQKYVTRS